MDTIEYMNRQEQSREDPDETVRMHRLSLTFAIRMQQELITLIKDFFVLTLACWVSISADNILKYFPQKIEFAISTFHANCLLAKKTQQGITSIYQHFIIILSDQDRCPLKLMDTIEYMNRQEQSREDPDETVRMHRLSLTFAIRMQQELITLIKDFFVLTLACWVSISADNILKYFPQKIEFAISTFHANCLLDWILFSEEKKEM